MTATLVALPATTTARPRGRWTVLAGVAAVGVVVAVVASRRLVTVLRRR